jgi:ribose transport system ATP-binding protein
MLDRQGPFIVARELVKSFGAVRALRGISLEIHRGQVHGFVGANGAGKSTLVNILGGVVVPDGGQVFVDGVETRIASPRAAGALGFSFIHQELALIPDFPAYENMTLKSRAQTPLGLADRGRRRAQARAAAERLHLKFDLDTPVKELSIAERGLVAIGRALVGEARFVFMDEPTASLSDAECERLFAVVRELTSAGVAVAYVSHRLDEILALSDHVSVFKDGQIVDRFERGHYTRQDLIRGITGSDTVTTRPASSAQSVRADRVSLLEVQNLSRAPRVRDVSFNLYSGEVLGLGGLMGSGRTEVARLIFGVDRLKSGRMFLDGKPYQPGAPSDAIKCGIALVPEERRSQALVMEESVNFNINLGNWRSLRLRAWSPLIDDKGARDRSVSMTNKLSIRAKGVGTAVRTLSGGNQQKVVFARWLLHEPRILLLDEPTRGVDIGARQQIWDAVRDYADAGGAVIVISSDLDELSICHRVIVLVEGCDKGEIVGPDIDEERVLTSIYKSEVSHVW